MARAMSSGRHSLLRTRSSASYTNKAAEHLACAELAAAADRQTAAVGCVGAPAPADGYHAGGFRSDRQAP
jgi:hypothetical protein